MIEKTDLKHVNNADDSQWFTIEVTVENLESDIHEKMKQKGTLSDEKDDITFTNWGAENLSEGEKYIIKNVQTDEYYGTISVNLNSSAEIITADEETVSKKPRSAILNEYSSDSTEMKDSVSVDRFSVTLDDLSASEPKRFTGLQTQNLDKYNVSPLEDELGVSFSNLRVQTSATLSNDETYSLEFLGTNDDTIYIGFKLKFEPRIHTIIDAQELIELQSISDESTTVTYSGSVKCMNIAVCDNCSNMAIAEELIDANPYSPSEDYLHFYDWWKDTNRHTISIPECPDCGMKELYPLEVPRMIDFVYKIPINERSVESIESAIQEYVDEGVVKITYTPTKTLEIIGQKIKNELQTAAQNAIESINILEPGVGRRYSESWPKRYISMQFDQEISEDTIQHISEVSNKFGEEIFTIVDEEDGTRIAFVAHQC